MPLSSSCIGTVPQFTNIEIPMEEMAEDSQPLINPIPNTLNSANAPVANSTQLASPIPDSATTLPSTAIEFAPDFYPLDPRFISFSRTTGFIFTAVFALGGLIACFFVWRSQGFNWITGLVASVFLILILASAWSSWAWPKVEFRNIRWRIDAMGLEIHRGVYWQHRIAIPVARLQHADISQGPIQRWYGLGKLTVFTAGTSHASIELDGLSHETATWLRDQLIRQREALDVV